MHSFLFFVLCSGLFYCIKSSSSLIRAVDSSFVSSPLAYLQPLLTIREHCESVEESNLGVIIYFLWINEEKIVASKCEDRHGKDEEQSAEL